MQLRTPPAWATVAAMRTLLLALALLLASCSDDTPVDTSTSGGTSTGVTSGETLDCDAPNACLEHPDACPDACTCNDPDFSEAKCVTTESGEYLARCVDGQALVGECPYGCGYGLVAGEPGACKPPPDECAAGTECGDIPAGCGSCSCVPGPDGGPFCSGALVLGGCEPSTETRHALAFCGFGCEAGACCLDEICP